MAKNTIENFGRNVSFSPSLRYQVQAESEVLAVLGSHRDMRFRAVGSLHAWSRVAETKAVLIEMQGLNFVEVADDGQSVWVGAGCKVKRLLQKLSRVGLTLPSVGLIDEQSVAGATATGTHGSGSASLSSCIKAVRIAHFDASGNPVLAAIDSGDRLLAARCSLGLLGIVVAIEFHCRGKYNIEEHALAHRTLASAIAMEADCPRSQFYLMPWSWTYFGHHRSESGEPRGAFATLYRVYCFLVIDVGLHVAVTFLARVLKSAWAIRFFFRRVLPFTILRRWKVVDDSHAMLVMEHELFRHIEIEVFVPRSKVQAATDFLVDVVCVFGGRPRQNAATTDALLDSVSLSGTLEQHAGSYVHHYPICYRRVLPDPTLISMTSVSQHADDDEDWYAISFISYQRPGDREGFCAFAGFVAAAVAKCFGGRCHWGKYNPLDAQQNAELYPQLERFQKVRNQFDPERQFSNDWLDEVI